VETTVAAVEKEFGGIDILVVRHNHRIPYRHAISYDAACARGSALR
jgi:hypothetical protein